MKAREINAYHRELSMDTEFSDLVLRQGYIDRVLDVKELIG